MFQMKKKILTPISFLSFMQTCVLILEPSSEKHFIFPNKYILLILIYIRTYLGRKKRGQILAYSQNPAKKQRRNTGSRCVPPSILTYKTKFRNAHRHCSDNLKVKWQVLNLFCDKMFT